MVQHSGSSLCLLKLKTHIFSDQGFSLLRETLVLVSAKELKLRNFTLIVGKMEIMKCSSVGE